MSSGDDLLSQFLRTYSSPAVVRKPKKTPTAAAAAVSAPSLAVSCQDTPTVAAKLADDPMAVTTELTSSLNLSISIKEPEQLRMKDDEPQQLLTPADDAASQCMPLSDGSVLVSVEDTVGCAGDQPEQTLQALPESVSSVSNAVVDNEAKHVQPRMPRIPRMLLELKNHLADGPAWMVRTRHA